MKTVLVTGATAGFGEAIANDLLKDHRVIVTGRRRQRLEEKFGSSASAFLLPFDVRDKSQVEKAYHTLPEKWKNIDILINNAGLAIGRSFIDSGLREDWDQMIDTNVKGLLYVTKTFIPAIKKSECGHIINIGSIAGKEVYPGGNVYCASKHAVDALSKAMRMELLSQKIKVTQIRPGLAETEFSEVRYKGDREKAKKVYEGYQALLAEDIAHATRFALEQPPHVCINDLEITPTAQANAYLIEKND